MHVSKDVVPRLHSLLYLPQKVDASCTQVGGAHVAVANGRAMGDEDVNAFRNLLPHLTAWFSTRQVKPPPSKFWLPTEWNKGAIDYLCITGTIPDAVTHTHNTMHCTHIYTLLQLSHRSIKANIPTAPWLS